MLYECVTVSAYTTVNATVAEYVKFSTLVSLFPEGTCSKARPVVDLAAAGH